MVDGGGQQTPPALRVVFVGQLAGPQLDIQHAVSGEDGPAAERDTSDPIYTRAQSSVPVEDETKATHVHFKETGCAYSRCCVSLLRSTDSSQ